MGQHIECDACGFKTNELTNHQYEDNNFKDCDMWLCKLCAGTHSGTASQYPDQYNEGDSGEILHAICYVGNMILKEIKNE